MKPQNPQPTPDRSMKMQNTILMQLANLRLWLLAALLALASSSFGSTIAYWTFEGDGVTTPTDGTFVKDTDGRVAPTVDGILVRDMSGNGNSLFTWNNDVTGHQYRTNVPSAIVPQTGAANQFSIQNNGNFPATMSWSTNSLPTVDVETIEPLAWTIEASIYQTASGVNETFVGRDGNGETNIAASARAPLYFKTFNGTLQILFTDVAGNTYDLTDTTGAISLNTWYNVAAVSDGTTLSLYRDSGAGYALVASMALTPGDTRLNYDNDNSSTVGDEQWGWSIGRGRYSLSDAQTDGHTDRFFGYIDNVRISDAALTTNQMLGYSTNVFVVSGPTPAAQTVALGNPFSFSILGGGESVTYQWRHAGTNLPGATAAIYSVAVSSAADLGNYDVVLTNSVSAVTSSVAVLSLHNPRPLTWGGVAGAWDTTSANWTTNAGVGYLAYIETDNVRFDPLGAAQPLVSLGAAHVPSSVTVSNGSYAFTGSSLSSAGALVLRNSSSLVLSNVNTFAGGTVVSNSVLHLRSVNNLGMLSLANGGAVQLYGNSHTVAGLSGAAGSLINSTSGAPVLTFGSNNVNATWSGSFTNDGGNVSFIKVGTGTNTFNGSNYLGGTAASQVNGGGLILASGGSFTGSGTAQLYIAEGASTGYAEVSGGSLTVSNWLVVGRNNAAANGTMVINSGTVSKQGSGNIVVGSLGATGTLIVNGGQVLNNANLWLGENSGANGTLRLNGGLLQATQIRVNGTGIASSTAYFNGGTLQPTAASLDFIQSPTVGAISAGGLNFDNNGFDVTIASLLVEDTVTPSTGGGLTKFGTGTLTLSGGYNYTGPTIVKAGTLSLNPSAISSSPAGNLVVSNSSLTVASGTTAAPATDVTFGTGAVLNLNYGTLGANPTVAAIAATGNLTASATPVTINISAIGLQVGTIPLITYAGTLTGFGNFVLGPLPPGVTASLANNPNSLDLVITATGQNLSWYGDVDNVWNINTTANWANSAVPGAKYQEYGATGDPVRLDDTAVGNYDINLTASVHPFNLVENAANNYSITGAGAITGPTSIVKSNTGTLFVGTANTYSGGTFVYGGSLAISNNSALGSSATNVTLAGGNLQLSDGTVLASRAVSVPVASTIGVPSGGTATVGGTISGAGALAKIDSGTLNITGSNNFTAALNANLGTINFSGTNIATVASPAYCGVGSALGSATLNLLPGANLSRFELKLGNQSGAKGTVNMTNATLTLGSGELWVGGSADNITCEGEFNLASGYVTLNNWSGIGRSFGTGASKGTVNISGTGAWTNQTANNLVIGNAANNIGVVNISGSGIMVAAAGRQFWVGEAGNGILNLNGGTALAQKTTSPALVAGRGGAGAGSIRLNSGLLESYDQTFLGHGTGTVGSYGELKQTGGTAISRWYFVVGFNNDRAIFRQSGGAFYITNAFMTVAAGGTASYGVADLSGGTFTSYAANNIADGGIYVAERGTAQVNIRGTAQVSVIGTTNGGGIRFGGAAGASGTLNLNGGVLSANRISKTTAATLAILNFNGGTLKAYTNGPTFLTGLNNAYVRPGGAIIDDAGWAITIAQPLLAPTDNGVTSIALTSGGSNYIGAPIVVVSGGTGTNCTAIANMIDDGSGNGTYSVGSVTITSPGVYTVDPTTVSFLMGGQNATVAVAGAITTAANTSGGLTKLGSGSLTLSGANTYTGATTVSNGTLNVNSSLAGAVTVKSGATLGGTGSIAGVVTAESGAKIGAGNSIGTLTLGASPSLSAGSTIVAELNRTNSQTADKIVVTGNPIAYSGTLILTNIGTPLQVGDTFTLFNASSYSGSFTIVSKTLGQVVTWNTSNLAANGTISVATVTPISVNSSVTGGTLSLTWPPNQLGVRLETNSVSVVSPASWYTYPGSTTVTNVSITIDQTKSNVYFRLVYP
ncbi:MAG: hypothetical protein EPO07_19110 [Verrucomicrobia bacterium]|nr:MAG: hypothetical protein EPO07_19110 [Verrucomicrobiota bacterium]